jgi:hypothetical protein
LFVLFRPASAQDDAIKTLINPYLYCVGRATARQPDRFKNPDAAIERSHQGCQTEELAIRSYGELNGLTQAEINLVIAVQRGRLKKSLSEALLEKAATRKR